MSDPAIIEAAARALEKFRQSLVFSPDAESVAKVVLATATPLIRAAALEEAAQVAEEQPTHYPDAEFSSTPHQFVKDQIAAAIRALKTSG